MQIIPNLNFISDLADSYKESHPHQIEPGTTHVSSFWESRGGLFPTVTFFGLQYFLKRYLIGQVVTSEMIDEAEEDSLLHFGQSGILNRASWEHIVRAHGGALPIRISAVPEGTVVPGHNALMIIESLDEHVPEIGQFVETLLSEVWYPSTVATQSAAMRRTLLSYLERTGDPKLVDFKLHDFGFRGSTSPESAGIGGMAHLVSFLGTDTRIATKYARTYYGERMAGYSVPAAEHFTVTSWGREREAEAYRHILEAFPRGIVSIVADSWDVFNACQNIFGRTLREQVLSRDGVLVVRPDSGNPPEVVCRVLDILGERFGTATNEKGYRVLNDKVRVIQGDGIDASMLDAVLAATTSASWSADNITFGSGGGLLQKVNRDTLKFAFKCSAACVNGTWRDVMKDPVTDPGKRSKAGRLALVHEGETWQTVTLEELERCGKPNALVPVFENGRLLRDYSFAEIRARAQAA